MIKRTGLPKRKNDEKRICNANQLNYICKIGLFTTEINQTSTKTLSSIQKTAASLNSELSTTDNAETSTPEMVTFTTSMVKPSSTTMVRSSILETVDTNNPVKKCNFFDVRAEYTEDVDWFCGKCIFFWE